MTNFIFSNQKKTGFNSSQIAHGAPNLVFVSKYLEKMNIIEQNM